MCLSHVRQKEPMMERVNYICTDSVILLQMGLILSLTRHIRCPVRPAGMRMELVRGTRKVCAYCFTFVY